jgi:hypothetical protein
VHWVLSKIFPKIPWQVSILFTFAILLAISFLVVTYL